MTTPETRLKEAPATRSEDTVQVAYERLRQEILMGQLAPGAILSQVQLAGRLGISRTPLREALRRLAAEGLVNGDFNRRVRVSELDLDDFDQIYAMRMALEPVAFEATIPVLTVMQLQALEDAVVRMDATIGSGGRAEFRTAHRAFHLGFTVGAGARMQRTLAELWDHSERYRLRYLHPEGSDDARTLFGLRLAQAEHREILTAAAERDVARCIQAQSRHLQRTLEAVFREAAPPPQARLTRLATSGR